MRGLVSIYLSSLAVLAVGFTGCSTGTVPASTATAAVAGSGVVHGNVHGGQQPVTGATIQVWAVGTAGDGSAATPLLATPVMTDSSGNFALSLTCPPSNPSVDNGIGSLIYLSATGGNPGLAAGTNNTAISLVSALSVCGNFYSGVPLVVNEVTTVAAVATLFPYMTSYSHMGAQSSDSAAFGSAFLPASLVYEDPTAGLAQNTGPFGQKLNSLANIISACINSSGGVAGDGSMCGKLFQYATPSGGSAPTDTVGALLNIAKNPTSNVGNLFSLLPSAPPFQPNLTAAPTDWSIYNSAFNVAVATSTNNGILELPLAQGGAGAFVVAAQFTGATSTMITVTPSTGSVTLPLALTVCQTNPNTGQCLAAPASSVTATFAPGSTPTFSVFGTASAAIAYDPNHDVFVQFADSNSGTVNGVASVYVETN